MVKKVGSKAPAIDYYPFGDESLSVDVTANLN